MLIWNTTDPGQPAAFDDGLTESHAAHQALLDYLTIGPARTIPALLTRYQALPSAPPNPGAPSLNGPGNMHGLPAQPPTMPSSSRLSRPQKPPAVKPSSNAASPFNTNELTTSSPSTRNSIPFYSMKMPSGSETSASCAWMTTTPNASNSSASTLPSSDRCAASSTISPPKLADASGAWSQPPNLKNPPSTWTISHWTC